MTEHASNALPPERPGRPAPRHLQELRERMTEAMAAGVWRSEPPAHEGILGGIRTLTFRPSRESRGEVLHLHAGGYHLGCPDMLAPFAATLAERCGVEVICPTYRLAPEYPMPAGLVDAQRVFAALRARGSGPLIISGDSAGGGLAASLTGLSVLEARAPMGLVLLSPWLDLTLTAESYETNAATDRVFSRQAATEAADQYLQGLSPLNPHASPLFGDVTGFPPTFISIGEGEVLADDGRQFHARLRAAGVEAHLLPVANMQHAAVTRALSLTGATETFAALTAFIDQLLSA